MENDSVLYRERNALVFWITLGCAILALGLMPWTPPREWWGLIFTAALMLLMGVIFIVDIVVTPEEFLLRLGLVYPFFRRQRGAIWQVEVYDKKWDGVNWFIRRIHNIEGQRGGKDKGILLRCSDGDFWVQSRQGEALVAALQQTL